MSELDVQALEAGLGELLEAAGGLSSSSGAGEPAAAGTGGGGRAAEAALEQFGSMFAAYNETTNRMRQSHQALQGEVARLREELTRKNEQLERKNRLAALGQMAAGMAHEIRNPLGGVQLYASLLKRDLAGQQEPLKWVGKISKAVHTLDSIVSDILAFTQEQTCQKADVAVMGLIHEVLDYLQGQVAAREARVEVSSSSEALTVQADVNMLRRVLFNLLRNALDAIEVGGVVAVRVEADKPGKDASAESGEAGVLISVSDTGPGIAAEVKGQIFNPFFTTKDTGTGLGLTIVHQLVECHGGRIEAENKEQGGATFSVYLP